MIVSPSRRFLFVHMPKTGGTALALSYEARARSDDLLFGDTPKAKRRQAAFNKARAGGKLRKHATRSDALAALPELDIAAYRTAMIVRNPWDRLVSFYHWAVAQRFDHPMIAAAQGHDFTAFLTDPRVQTPIRRHGVETYLTGPEGLPAHLTLLRHETLQEDTDALARSLDIRLPPLARVNASERPRDWRPFYTDATAALIPGLCPYEVETLQYTFDP